MNLYSLLVVLFCFVGPCVTQSCEEDKDVTLGLSQLTVYDVAINPEDILKGPIYQLGNYDECLNTNGRQHCVARVHLHPGDNPSQFWSTKQTFSTDRLRIPRDELFVGLCVPSKCNSSSTAMAFSKKLKPAANALGVKASVNIEPSYCQKSTDVQTEIGDYVMGVLSLIGATLLFVATVYEGSVLLKQRKIGNSLVVQIILCFSVINNWKRLWTTSKTKPLRGLQGIRFVTMYLIIAGHASYAMFITAHDNPEWIEAQYSEVLRALIFNGHLVTCTFFVIGGYLLGYLGMVEMEKDGFTFVMYLKTLLQRYVRLTTSVAVIVAVAANWLKYFGSGPMWPFYGLIEINNCKHHWWINLMYMQNYFYAEKPCMLHLWYLAADFQNFIVFALLLGFVYKHPKWTKTVFASSLAVFIFIPFIQTYVEQLDPTVLTYPRNFRNVTYNMAYLRNYVTFHHNAAPYLIGMIFGYAYYVVISKGIKFSKATIGLIWCIVLTVPWGVMLLGYFFYQPSYQYNVYVASAYAGFSKSIYAIGIGLILIGCTTGLGWIANTALSWRPFQVLGRLTFCSYLVHLLVLESEYASVKRSLHVTINFVVRQTLADVMISMVAGLALCLCVELPTSAILKLINTYSPKGNELPRSKGVEANVPSVTERVEDMYRTFSERL